MTRKEYNGWTNYETWLVKLWMDNDQGSYEYWREATKEHLTVDKDDGLISLADQLKEEHTEAATEGLEGFRLDLMGAALSEVDWREIAESLIKEGVAA
jgi:hypothetical protein